jgi:hypothetical protein
MDNQIRALLGHNIGDVLSLSDIQAQMMFNVATIDMNIEEIRYYEEPEGLFKYTGYIVTAPDDVKYMLLIREIGELADTMLMFLDQENDISVYIDAGLLTNNRQDFIDTFPCETPEGESFNWIRKRPSIFGVNTTVITDDHETDQKTLIEYTADVETKNSDALLEWSGNEESGWLEVWYGCQVKPYEIKILEVVDDD